MTNKRGSMSKDGNPKDGVGSKKVSLSNVPLPVLMEVALGMQEGALKYGRHNYRVYGVRESVYFDAAIRHLFQYWEGEDVDEDSNLSHVTKAICSLVVLRDAQIRNMSTDDRPPGTYAWIAQLNEHQNKMVTDCPNPLAVHVVTP